MAKFQAVRGTHDLLPADAAHFTRLEMRCRALFQQFGFHEIRTPTFESYDLFHRSLGETTDVVEKEMYVFEDRGGRRLALRPEGTAGVVRAFVEHHLDQTTPFCKLFYIGPMFRAERPQAGRYREFWQIGAEYFGNGSPVADAELLVLTHTLFHQLGVEKFELTINSLGDEKCRPLYLEALRKAVEASLSDFCEDCRRRYQTNLLRVLDCKIDGEKFRKKGAYPSIDQYWCADCRRHFDGVKNLLRETEIPFQEDAYLVRGLDYYTRTVFEVKAAIAGSQNAIAAGGRYDRLVKELGGPDIPALGFALGSERVLEAAQASSSKGAAAQGEPLFVFVAAIGESVLPKAFQWLERLRQDPVLRERGWLFEGGFFEKKLGAQLALADRLKAAYCLILGEEELQRGEVTWRSLRTSSQQRWPEAELRERLLALHA